MFGQEKGKSPRINTPWPISVLTTKGPLDAKLANLRPDGAYIYCNQTPETRHFVALTIDPPDRAPLKITGEVVSVDRFSSPGMEVSFRQMSEKDRQFLHEAIAEHYESKGRITWGVPQGV